MPSYRTLVLREGKAILIRNEVPPATGAQLVVRPLLVGICRSDIKEFLGVRTVRSDFGHEMIGEVVAANTAELPSPGTLVVLDPHISIQRSSGFGELIVASGKATQLAKAFIPVPSTLCPEKLVFLEPLACAYHCVSRLLSATQRDLKGLRVGIVGSGMAGTLIGLLCQSLGASVVLMNRSPARLDFLRSRSVFAPEELSLNDHLPAEFDCVIPTTSFLYPEVMEICVRIVREGGTVLLYAGTRQGDVFPDRCDLDLDHIRRSQTDAVVETSTKSFTLRGTHGAETEDFLAVLSLLQGAPECLPVEKLICQRIALDCVSETLALQAQEDYPGKTVVCLPAPL